MGVIAITGKFLEISGKIMQAEAVEKWLESKGQELLEQWVVKKGVQTLSMEEKKDKVIEALRKPLHSRPFALAVDGTFDEFLVDVSRICQAAWSVGALQKDATAMLPVDLVQGCALWLMERRIGEWAEFNRLYDSDLLRQAFFEEWRTSAIEAIRKSNLSPESPFKLGDGFWIASIDDDAYWSAAIPSGAFYIHHSSSVAISDDVSRKIISQIETLDRKRGRLSTAELEAEVESSLSVMSRIKKYRPTTAQAWIILAISRKNFSLSAAN